jgi:hypothetical protein
LDSYTGFRLGNLSSVYSGAYYKIILKKWKKVVVECEN